MAKQSEKFDQVLKDLEKKFGKGTIITDGGFEKIEKIPTGSYKLDALFGGYPEGRITEIYGNEGSGKTTLSLHAIAQCQKKYPDKKIIFVDSEFAFDSDYAKNIGIDVNKLVFYQSNYAEETLEVIRKLIESGEVALVVLDSVASLVSKQEMEGEIGELGVGKLARILSQGLKMIIPAASNNNTAVIFLNQTRQNIGGMYYAPKEVTPGGMALKFYSSLILEVRKITADKTTSAIVSRVKVSKSKVSKPYVSTDIVISYNVGIDVKEELYDACLQLGILERKGAYYYVSGNQVGKGIEEAKNFIFDNEEYIKSEIQKRGTSQFIFEDMEGEKTEV